MPNDAGDASRADRDADHGRYGPKRFVAFVDILGFSDFVGRADEQPELIEKIQKALAALATHSTGPENEAPHNAIQASVFSDNIVISGHDQPYGLGILLIGTAGICLRLLELGFLTRGGIAYGKLAHDKRMVFGPGLVEAAELERSVAHYPRVVLSESVVARAYELIEQAPDFGNFLRVDSDGLFFLHYLHKTLPAPFYRLCLPVGATLGGARLFEPVREVLLQLSARKDMPLRTRSKVVWMVSYLNRAAADLGLEPISPI